MTRSFSEIVFPYRHSGRRSIVPVPPVRTPISLLYSIPRSLVLVGRHPSATSSYRPAAPPPAAARTAVSGTADAGNVDA